MVKAASYWGAVSEEPLDQMATPPSPRALPLAQMRHSNFQDNLSPHVDFKAHRNLAVKKEASLNCSSLTHFSQF